VGLQVYLFSSIEVFLKVVLHTAHPDVSKCTCKRQKCKYSNVFMATIFLPNLLLPKNAEIYDNVYEEFVSKGA
jgi:hypothetical protein